MGEPERLQLSHRGAGRHVRPFHRLVISVVRQETARGLTLCVLVGAGVALRGDWPLAAATGLAALVAATTWAHRALVAILFLGLIVGAPWPTPALASLTIWMLLRRSLLKSELSGMGAIPALGLGIVSGGVALLAVLPQLDGAPLAWPTYRPSAPGLTAAVLTAAFVNAVAEEGLWRWALYFGHAPVGLVFVGQTVSFGIAHRHGIPGGTVGVGLAMLYSAVVVSVRRHWGLAASVCCHFGSDVVIFAAVAMTSIFLPSY